MANVAQVVAGVAAGGITAIAVMLLLEVYRLRQQGGNWRDTARQQDVDRQSRIDSAARTVLGDIETIRQAVTGVSTSAGSSDPQSEDTIEVRSKAHLRMLVHRPRASPVAGREGPASSPGHRSRSVRR